MESFATITMYANILLMKVQMGPKITNIIHAIKFCNQMCMFSLKDLQDMSNIVREQFKIQMASFNVRDAFDEIISMYRMSADLKGINIDCHISDDVPQELIQDKMRVQQIISNLINNALKFSDNDTEVNIRCRFFPRSSKMHI